jgi:hypothetical protein
MDKIRITATSMNPRSVKFTKADGTELSNVAACDIRMRPDEANRATIWLNVDEMNIEAEPLLSFDTVSEAARAYGYELVPFQIDRKASISPSPGNDLWARQDDATNINRHI